MTLVLITSIINPPNTSLSYSKTRSVFTRDERFLQTKNTIDSVKQKIPNSKIMIVECASFTSDELTYFNNNCDFILNLWEKVDLHEQIFNKSKSLGEGTMTIEALTYIHQMNIEYDVLYKISGRYVLNDNFILSPELNIFKKIDRSMDNVFTALYKLERKHVYNLITFLKRNKLNMINCVGYEVLMANYVKTLDVMYVDIIGLSGMVTVCGSNYNG
jgi:hypothetical protein